jgi:hypothetical protein
MNPIGINDQTRYHDTMRAPRRTNLARAIAALLLVAAVLSSRVNAADIGPFDALTDIPAQVDAAAVFENPAESILLSPVGRSMRSLLALGGVFTQTEDAWGTLARTFNEPIDATIRNLLSGEVAVVWDNMGEQPNADGNPGSFDSNWTIVCKVQPEYLQRIRRSLKPVKREIVHSRTLYAIEQGRYAISLIDAPDNNPELKATVLLAPRSGTDLLKAILEHAKDEDLQNTSPITSGHEPMLAELSTYHESLGDGSWSFVFISRLELLNAIFVQPTPEAPDEPHTLAALVKLNPDTLLCTFATDIQVDEDTPDAPIELFDAVAPESVFTIATARAPTMSLTSNAFSLNLAVTSAAAAQAPTDPVLDAPALLSMSPGDASSMSVTACFVNERREPGQTARLSDQTVRSLINAFDPAQSPDFRGRFPRSLRQIDLRMPVDTGRDPGEWPGLTPSLAWKTASTTEHDLIIASIAPRLETPNAHIERIEDAALALDALNARPRSGVLLRVSFDPERALKIINDPDILNIALAKIIRRFDMGVRRGIDAPIRGRVEISFTASASAPKLGRDTP